MGKSPSVRRMRARMTTSVPTGMSSQSAAAVAAVGLEGREGRLRQQGVAEEQVQRAAHRGRRGEHGGVGGQPADRAGHKSQQPQAQHGEQVGGQPLGRQRQQRASSDPSGSAPTSPSWRSTWSWRPGGLASRTSATSSAARLAPTAGAPEPRAPCHSSTKTPIFLRIRFVCIHLLIT
jgi:hypothetical protein